MKKNNKIDRRLVSALICAGILTGLWASAQVSVSPRPLSEWMPGGALLYLESSDFATQLRDWNRSEVKAKWLASKNFEEFSTTRLVLKLKDVYGEFANAAGFEPNLTELETVAGTSTALALYDIGKLDLVYITRLPSALLGQNVLTRVRSGYETRTFAATSYFVRQSGTRTAAFAIVGDYAVVSTREDLLTGALDLIQGSASARSIGQENWYQDAVRALPVDAAVPVAFRLVMDLPSVIRTPYFRSYWIQRNRDELQNYSAFLSQIERKADALEENRVLIRSAEAPAVAHEAATAELQRYVPDNAGLFRLWDTPSVAFTMDLIRRKFFAAGAAGVAPRQFAPVSSTDGPVGSESDLQTRIDEPPKPSLSGGLELEPLRALLAAAGLEAALHLESSGLSGDAIFVASDAAVGLRAASAWDAGAIRAALTSAVASYQSVSAIGLQWRNVASGGTTLSQWNGLLPLTMFVDGQTLWIARSPALLGSALAHAATSPRPAQTATYLARYLHRGELANYLKLMRMLDLSDQSRYSAFFSENIGSLASTLDVIDSVSVSVTDSPLVERQAVRYGFAR